MDRAISLIIASLDRLDPINQTVEDLFHLRLLDTYPDVYRFFVMDIEPGDRRLLNVLAHILGHVRQCGAVAPTVRTLAGSHRVFQLIEAHYAALAETLIWTLRRSLGDSFTVEVERAWMGALWETLRGDDLKELDDSPICHINTPSRAGDRREFNIKGAMRRVVSN